MQIREYTPCDCEKIAKLFYETVHNVNAKDYSESQLNAWADGKIDVQKWNESFQKNTTLIAEKDGIIVGFGDMDSTGYLDRLYIHKDFIRCGFGAKIVAKLEDNAKNNGIFSFSVHASITAVPFFEKMGYRVKNENKVVRNGVSLTNFTMEKSLI